MTVLQTLAVLDQWANDQPGRSHETCRRNVGGGWTAVAWENGKDIAAQVGASADAARRALAVVLAKEERQ